MKRDLFLKSRREFLRTGFLGASLSWTVPSFLAQTFDALHREAADRAVQTSTGRDSTILVVLQMAGGNDGLNTVAPYSNDHYQRARPNLRLPLDSVVKINDELGFHAALAPFKDLFDAGHLSVVQGAGYPNPNRSHFRSTEIWQTASDSNRNEKYGWLGRYFDHACKGADPTVGVSIGKQTPQAFAGPQPIGISLISPESYRFSADEMENGEMSASDRLFRKLNQPENDSGASIGAISGPTSAHGSPLDYLQRIALEAQVSSDRILAVSRKAQNQASYPASQLANSLKLVARLIGGGLPTRVYYVSQGGYDTHANQRGAHERLLKDLAESVHSFSKDLQAQGNFDRVLVMTFSEFGRRVSENANGGTDHGAAAPLFLIGAKLKAGLLGAYPSLAPQDLFNGDLKFRVDFRSVYAGVLEDWLRTNSTEILGKRFDPLTLLS